MQVMIQFDDTEQERILDKLRTKEQQELTQDLSDQYGLPYVDLTSKAISGKALRTVSLEKAKEAYAAPFKLVNDTLYLGVKSPEYDKTQQLIEELKEAGYEVDLYMVADTSLEKAWQTYEDLSHSFRTQSGTVDISKENVESYIESIDTIDDAAEEIKALLGEDEVTKTSQIVEALLASALAVDASDIHIEPEEEAVGIRFRVDGVLTDITSLDHDTFSSLSQRIKLVSGMKLNVTNEAQDGRFTINVAENEIEVRSSVIPGPYGEGIVMRVLDPTSIQVDLEELGIHSRLLETFREEINRPHGMILNTGPTGSGKTTTLYSFLRELNSPKVKILTIENPIEYHLEGIAQTQVDRTSGYDFKAGLRSALRQDPDVIMVGEIRDEETAEIAINAALTGHLVLSTLHTNDAAGTFPRLIDLGVNPNVITSAVNMSMAQRLVRTLCESCKKEYTPDEEEREIIDNVVESIDDTSYLEEVQTEKLWKPEGCKECNEIGYKGRVGIFEAILGDESLGEALSENPGIREIWEAVEGQNILSMRQDGILKVLEGKTSLKELGRVVDLEREH